eukprot:6200621-Pleurochrysis_carterae.AAC.3
MQVEKKTLPDWKTRVGNSSCSQPFPGTNSEADVGATCKDGFRAGTGTHSMYCNSQLILHADVLRGRCLQRH